MENKDKKDVAISMHIIWYISTKCTQKLCFKPKLATSSYPKEKERETLLP